MSQFDEVVALIMDNDKLNVISAHVRVSTCVHVCYQAYSADFEVSVTATQNDIESRYTEMALYMHYL